MTARVLFDGIPAKILAMHRRELERWAADEDLSPECSISLHNTPSMTDALLEINRPLDAPIMFETVRFKKTPLTGGWDNLDRFVLVEPLSEADATAMRKMAEVMK